MTPGPQSVPRSAEIVVVGGGIVGLSIAWEATRRGARVLVVERQRAGGGATRVAAGMLAPVSEARPTEREIVDFGRRSLELYPEFVGTLEAETGVSCRLTGDGVLLAALGRDQLEILEHEVGNLEAMDLDFRRLDAAEVLELEPRLHPSVLGGLLTPGDGSVDPRAMSRALVAAIRARRGTILEGWTLQTLIGKDRVDGARLVRVDDPESGDDGDSSSSVEIDVETGAVVVAAGARSAQVVGALAGLPLRPVKGQLVRLRGEVLLGRTVRTPDVYLVPRDDGELIVGASSEEQGFDDTATAGVVMELLRDAGRILPPTRELELCEICVGFRPALRDNLPAIGPVGPAGLWVATGHYRNGILLAPATARALLDTMESGKLSDELRPFAADRFSG